VDVDLEVLDQLVIELEVQLGLVAEAPYRGLIAGLFAGGPGGNCVRICPQICPLLEDRLVRINARSPICRGF
jgi:hypothetical protein